MVFVICNEYKKISLFSSMTACYAHMLADAICYLKAQSKVMQIK